MTVIDEHGRPEPPMQSPELETLLGFLEWQRSTFAWKCTGLDADHLRRVVGVSTMTIGGLLKHMTFVEQYWFRRALHGADPLPPWDTIDWATDRDWDWRSATHDTPDELESMWRTAVQDSRDLVTTALQRGGLDQLADITWPNRETPNLRWIIVHMIEEYARHNGHADLIRETIDGAVGE